MCDKVCSSFFKGVTNSLSCFCQQGLVMVVYQLRGISYNSVCRVLVSNILFVYTFFYR